MSDPIAYASTVLRQATQALSEARIAVEEDQRTYDQQLTRLTKTTVHVAERRQLMNAAPGDKARRRAYNEMLDAQTRQKKTVDAAANKLAASQKALDNAKTVHTAAQRNLDTAKRQSR